MYQESLAAVKQKACHEIMANGLGPPPYLHIPSMKLHRRELPLDVQLLERPPAPGLSPISVFLVGAGFYMLLFSASVLLWKMCIRSPFGKPIFVITALLNAIFPLVSVYYFYSSATAKSKSALEEYLLYCQSIKVSTCHAWQIPLFVANSQ
jgi:hypothetical protein